MGDSVKPHVRILGDSHGRGNEADLGYREYAMSWERIGTDQLQGWQETVVATFSS
jgi:hypothetical protein